MSSSDVLVRLSTIPTAALCFRDGRCVAINRAYRELMGYEPTEVVGRSLEELVDLVAPVDGEASFDAPERPTSPAPTASGQLWCRVVDRLGRSRAVRVQWTEPDDDGAFLVFLLDAAHESASKALAEALARAGGELVRCRDDAEVLARAADALYDQGLSVSVVLVDGDAPELAYGPSRTRFSSELGVESKKVLASVRPRRAVLEELNPHFHERRARFFHDPSITIDVAYPAAAREALGRVLAGMHLVQAPLFVEGQPYGALIVHSAELTPSRAATVEMFAELVARALESVRSQRRAEQRLEELQRLQAELLERERLVALGEAAAVMAHEVRNPIGAISNALAVLRREPARDEATDMLRVIAEEAHRLERIVRDLLDLGRPLAPRRQHVDLHELAIECVRTLRDRREGSALVFEVRHDGDAHAFVDPDLLQLALLNVLQNAIQVSPSHGRITLEVDAAEARARIAVEDEGPGFSDDVARKMFEPFFTTRPSGTGIGLAVVRRIVEANGGEIRLGRAAAGGARIELAFTAAD